MSMSCPDLSVICKWKGNHSRFVSQLELAATKGRYKMKVGVLETTGAGTWIFQDAMKCRTSSYKRCDLFIFMDALQFMIME